MFSTAGSFDSAESPKSAEQFPFRKCPRVVAFRFVLEMLHVEYVWELVHFENTLEYPRSALFVLG